MQTIDSRPGTPWEPANKNNGTVARRPREIESLVSAYAALRELLIYFGPGKIFENLRSRTRRHCADGRAKSSPVLPPLSYLPCRRAPLFFSLSVVSAESTRTTRQLLFEDRYTFGNNPSSLYDRNSPPRTARRAG